MVEEIFVLRTSLVYALAALAEIGGCFVVWKVVRQGLPAGWLVLAAVLLGGFACLLARADQAFAGRAFASYGGVYVAFCLLWLWAVEGVVPSGRDLLGGAVVLAGAAIIFSGGRT